MNPDYNYKPTLWLRKLGQVWQVYKDGKSIFHGTKKECESFISK